MNTQKHIVRTVNDGQPFYLRGTTWSFHLDRAQQFETTEAARAALERAKPFMKSRAYKAAYLETIAS